MDPRYASDISDGVKSYSSEAEFRDILTQLKKEGAFPFPMHVNTKMAPFWRDSGGGSAGGSAEGAHVVNITDFNPQTGRVEIDNQWSSVNDRNSDDSSVPIAQLYHASLAKLASLQNLIWEGKVSGMDSKTFDRNVLDMAKHFGLISADLVRGLDRRPQSNDEAKLAGITGGFMDESVTLSAKVDLIRIFGTLSETHRDALIETFKVEEEKRLAEAREFNRNYAE